MVTKSMSINREKVKKQIFKIAGTFSENVFI